MKSTLPIIPLLIISISLFYGCKPPEPPTQTQETLWNELNAKFITLYQQGRYSEAVKPAKEALTVAENTFGPNHPNFATSLNNLAELYHSQGKYAQAEALHKRALAIVEKALGPEHPHVATVLENMAKCSRETGKIDEAKKLEARAKKIRANR